MHGLLTALYLGSTESSIDHEMLTVLAYVVLLIFMSLVKTQARDLCKGGTECA